MSILFYFNGGVQRELLPEIHPIGKEYYVELMLCLYEAIERKRSSVVTKSLKALGFFFRYNSSAPLLVRDLP